MKNKKNKIKKYFSAMSLVEAIVAIGIVVMAMAVFSLFFINSWKTNSFILEEGQASFQASRAVEQTVKELRKIRQADNGNYPIESADANNLTIYFNADDDTAIERVHYYLDTVNHKMKKGITNPVGVNPTTYPAGDEQIIDLAMNVMNDATNPIFSYYKKDYLANPNAVAVPVISGDISDIRMVKIKFLVDINTNRGPTNVPIESFVELRNLENYVP